MITELLKKHQASFASVVPFDWAKNDFLHLDFTQQNTELEQVELQNSQLFSDYVFGKLLAAHASVGVGGYNEHRTIYRRSAHFQQTEEPRCIHLGVDIWAGAGTPVFSPLAGRVHSFANNANFGDYGPTIILEHRLENQLFYSLYGHLSAESLEGLYEGKPIEKGQLIATFGQFPINGDWPPHLHFQLMTDLLGLKGDFPGVCTLRERAHFLQLCPDPNLILGIPGLFQ
ncbi:peptidoglycan DD-metalloendopeptidase family protein [Runella aurantiaca]|uniref:Peptidase M23 n=1 Tax=Runella aurantiaca TaxID=2282308 RepID=A0A369II57_9BACT|nr:peptidoglycan DD-metalloendopeptidase family protein [Runella aurantiaca]RDB06326.1 peptidase M23 [Runella aurantiaca]